MKKIYEKLIKLSSNINGEVIVIGVNHDKYKQELEKNEKITSIKYLDAPSSKGISIFSNPKNINVRKFRRKFKKKKHDILICNNDQMHLYYKYFIKDSIYITKSDVYLIGSNIDDVELLETRYKRYNVKISKTVLIDSYLLIIDVRNAKNNKIKDSYYYFKDSFHNFFEYISNFLIG